MTIAPADPTEPAIIACQDFHKSYGETMAVRGISFQVAGGQILGLLGPNGAGKTTTLRAIAGILPPTRGNLFVNDHHVVLDAVRAKREMAYIPDDPKLFESLTVTEHLDFIASLYDVADHRPLADELLAQFELLDKRNTVCQELSRGMRQKVAIACGYLYRPKALLFDEPLTGLDPKAIRRLKDSIRERAAAGTAVIVSSHLLSLVEDLCSHLLIMRSGESVFFGPIDEARSSFADLGDDASLEEVFFRATEEVAADSREDPS